MVKIPFWVIKGSFKNGRYFIYGKGLTELNLHDSFAWQLKEYGYRTKSGAIKGIESAKRFDLRVNSGVNIEYSVEKIDVDFSEEDARRFRLI